VTANKAGYASEKVLLGIDGSQILMIIEFSIDPIVQVLESWCSEL